MIRFKRIAQKPTQVNIPNLLNSRQLTAGFILKWFKNEFLVNKCVHLHSIWEIWEINQIKLSIKDNGADHYSLDLARAIWALWIFSQKSAGRILYIYIYIYICKVIPRHIFLSLNHNRCPRISRTGNCQKTLDHAGKFILSQSRYSLS